MAIIKNVFPSFTSTYNHSDLVVVTCHRDQTVASRIEYDNNGKIKAISNSAREVYERLGI